MRPALLALSVLLLSAGGPHAQDRGRGLDWRVDPDFTDDVFTFVRIDYDASSWAGGWKNDWPDCDEKQLKTVVRAAFGQRRKTLRNNLKGLIDVSRLEALGIDPGARADTLELAQFIELANALGSGNEQ